ncbi:MAG: TonB-dependent receptor [Ferruginibacter sp.]
MKKLIVFFTVLFFTDIATAQIDHEALPDANAQMSLQVNSNTIYGKLIDKGTGKPVEAASVQLYHLVAKKKTDTLYDGMLSKQNGEFRFKRLPKFKTYRLVVTALGYETLDKTISIVDKEDEKPNNNFEMDLGNLVLETSFKQLSTVIISSVKPALEMGIDRKIFNVDKSLISTGGTAVDIMKSIPSVSVDIEGNVELRSSTPQIFIDGRPTILTLDQIPADHIDKIELITNPSAKFDAASSGGIINIVLKKNKRIGLNGALTLSGGTPSLLSGNLNLNLRQGKFNFFVSAGHNQSGGVAKGRTLRQNKTNGVITDYFNQSSHNNRNKNFNSIRFGTDIFIDNRNTVSISENIVKGRFDNNEIQNQDYLDNNMILQRYGVRTTDGKFGFDRNNTRANYKHTFPKDGQELTADLSYNYGTRSSKSGILNEFYNPGGNVYQPPSIVNNDGATTEKEITVQVDYTNPISEKSKIETGLRSYHNNFNSYYNAYADNNGQPIKLPLSNNYIYKDMINAAYFTYSHKATDFSYQLGLRAEYSKFDGELVDSAYKFGYEYPNKESSIWTALFPSLFLTHKLDTDDEIQFNFSRRIRRPRFWELNPFIDINDPANLQQGNPQLKPEFINSFELNYSKNYKGGNFLAVLYFKNNPKDITNYSDTITAAQYQLLNNAAIDPNALLNTYINASTTNRYGAEFTLQHKIGNNFDITPTFNLQYRTVNAVVKNLDLSNKGFNWEAKLITNYKIDSVSSSLFSNLGFQLVADYESPKVIPQGRRIAEFDVDFAIKKDFMKNKKASLTFAVSDVFNTRRWGAIYDTERFYQDAYRRWNVRNFRVSFSYKFGDTNFSLFNRGSKGGGGDDD